MNNGELLNLSVGDSIPGSRFGARSWSGEVVIQGKPVSIDVTRQAVKALAGQQFPVLAELELYFSCLVRKQVRFRTLAGFNEVSTGYARVLPGLFASFRAVCTQHCRIADVGNKPPVETLPVKRSSLFVPDWLKLDFRAGQWLGAYGFKRTL
ncbi:MAG TPA: hypothetical protein ENK49_06780 [Gammaproteobacteria bacterium]|nr:hypothetical protein [Gammaproteobacteria bacterium]